MNTKALYDAITELKQQHLVTGRDELLKSAVISAIPEASANSEIIRLVMNFLDGGRRMSEIITELDSFAAGTDGMQFDLSKLIAVYTDIDKGSKFIAGKITDMTGDQSLSANPLAPGKDDPHVSIIQIFPADITPANRFADASTLFLTTIPTIELSRCVPFLDVRMILPRKMSDGRKPLSLFNFLQGNAPAADDTIANANMVTIEGIVRDSSTATNSLATFQHTVSGMEVFTSPQTLVNVDDAYENSNRTTPVIDPFRPLLSLKNIEFTVIPTTGMMSYKSAKLQFVCHDRSRLAEIADLVRPDLYSTVELLIEYGWSHPDGSASSENSYGKLINNMHAREKYGVMNSSFTFSEAGQVDITLDLYMKGVVDFTTTKIAQSKQIIILADKMQELTEAISEIRSKIQNVKGTKEVRGATILSSASDLNSSLTLSDEALSDLKKFLHSKGEVGSSTAQLQTQLVALFGDNGQGGAKKALEDELSAVMQAKLDSLTVQKDPPLEKLNASLSQYKEVSAYNTQTYVSLAKLMMRFVAEPLLAGRKFNEVHIIFYSFNSGAGAVKDTNIGSYPIKVADFRKSFESFTKKKGKFNITLREFIDYLSENFIADPSNSAFGMSSIYSSTGFDENGNRKPVEATVVRSNSTKGVKAAETLIAKSAAKSAASEIADLGGTSGIQAAIDAKKAILTDPTTDRITAAKVNADYKALQLLLRKSEAADRIALAAEEAARIAENNALSTVTTTVHEQADSDPATDATAINSSVELRMQQLGIPDGTFRMPEIDLIVEAVPQGLGAEGEGGDIEWTLLRIHVIDKVASPYAGVRDLLAAMLDGNLGSFGNTDSPDEDQSKHKALASTVIETAIKVGLIEEVGGLSGAPKSYKLGSNTNPKGIKDFVSKLVPTLRYGTQTSGMKTISMRSLQDPLLNTIHMQRAGLGDPSEAPGTDGDIVPLQMLPTELDMDAFGCPLVTFGQQFFIDLDTGTTIDNIYGVTALTHTLSPGQFDSSFKMINIDAYGKYRSIVNSIATAIKVLGATGEGALGSSKK